MIVCPVCEHAQAAGTECDVCGRALADAGLEVDLGEVPPLEGIEQTPREPAPAPAGTAAELEPTAHARADARVPAAPFDPAMLEATRTAPVDVEGRPLAEIEPTAQELPGAPTALPAFAVCRYCRTPALPGERLCSRCGMRLPVVAGAAGPPAPEPPRICGCGALVHGRACPSCGARFPR